MGSLFSRMEQQLDNATKMCQSSIAKGRIYTSFDQLSFECLRLYSHFIGYCQPLGCVISGFHVSFTLSRYPACQNNRAFRPSNWGVATATPVALPSPQYSTPPGNHGLVGDESIYIYIYLVGGLVAMFYFPIYWVSNHPN